MSDKKIIKQLLNKYKAEEVARMLEITEDEVKILSKAKNITEENIVKINELYNQGMSLKDIGKHIGYSEKAVRRHIKNFEPRKKRVSENQKDTIKTLYEMGKDLKYISKITGLQIFTVRENVKKLVPTYKVKKIKRLTKEEQEILINLYKEGESVKDIAKILKVNTSTIHRNLKKLMNK